MTATQSKNIRNGARRIMEAANRAVADWYYSCSVIGTWESKRGKRTHRGREVN